ncbi:MAG: CmcJ/NvfI family oxidoreductase [Candidatus Binataceae bacterium]
MNDATRVLESVETHLIYAAPDAGFCRKSMLIHDARAALDPPSLNREGFALRRHATAVANFFDPAEVRSTYYPEVEQLLMETTGAARAFAFEHDVRCVATPERREREAREAVKVVHDDYTAKSAPERARLYLPDEAEALLQGPYAVINVWRPIRGPVLDTPLAVCDARTIAEADLVPTEQGVKHEVYLFNFNPSHRWYYFSAMTTSEVLLLKCFDSRIDGRARITAHSAFDLPAETSQTPSRQSIEVRALVFFPPISASAGSP